MMIPFDVAIQHGGHDSTQYSCEQLRNLYIDVLESQQKKALVRFPGLTKVGTGTGADRGHYVMSGQLFVINGNTLYEEYVNGVRVALGTVGGLDRAQFADDGTNLLFIADTNVVYRWNGVTLSAIAITSVTNPSTLAYINKTFIVTGDSGEFATSNVGDPGTWNPVNQGEAETLPDGLIRAYVFNQLVYMLGGRSTETWYYSGTGNPPLDRQDTGLINYGIAGKYAIDNSNEFLYWLDDDRQPVQCVGASARGIDTTSIAHIISELTTISDCIVSTFRHKKQWFVLFKFPTDGVDLVYSETFNYWFVLSSGTDRANLASWLGNEVVVAFGKNYVIDKDNGHSYYLDAEKYTNDTATILWQFVTQPFTSANLGISDYRRVTARQLAFEMQTGDALTFGQGSDPVLMCEFSSDGGQVWSAQAFVETGDLGAYKKRVDFYKYANGYELRARVGGSDPVPITIYGGRIDLIDGGY